MHRALRRLLSAILVMLAALILLGAGLVLTGRNAIAITHGISMNPVYHQGDLVVLARSSTYQVGQIAAYRIPSRDKVVLHRIVAGDDTGFTFKGDNNQSTDPAHPSRHQLVGRAVFSIPGGDIWLHRIALLLVIGLVATLLFAGNGANRRRRRNNRRNAMSRHANSRTQEAVGALRSLSPPLAAAAAVVGVAAGLGLLLGSLAWTTPQHRVVTVETEQSRQVAFSYTAKVRPSAAYDGTQVSSPDPIFRAVADTVELHLAYVGAPGTISVAAELSTPSGWRSTVALSPTTTISAGRHSQTTTLALAPLEAKARAGAAATGIPASEVFVTIRPRIATATGAPFLPTLRLTLTPQQLRLTDEKATLRVTDSTPLSRRVSQPVEVALAGFSISVTAARIVSALTLLACVLAAIVILFLTRRLSRLDEAALIRRRFGRLLVTVQPISIAAGRPLVDVTEIATLVRLAERYGLLILSWTRSGVATFLVQDENTTYRYRTCGTTSAPSEVVGIDA